VVARQFCLPEGYKPCNLITEWHDNPDSWVCRKKENPPVVHVPFVAYKGELDSDRTYDLVGFFMYISRCNNL